MKVITPGMEDHTFQSSYFQGRGVQCLACVPAATFHSLCIADINEWSQFCFPLSSLLYPFEVVTLFFSTSLIYDHRRCSRVIYPSLFLPSPRISASFYWRMMFRARGLGAGCAGYYWRVTVLAPLRGHGWETYASIGVCRKIFKNWFTLIRVTPVQQHRI